ncbi:MAG: NAD(P)-dependent oxidoreductase [Rhodospirillaceae bacterium]|nr:NAD(P)-dependent oxidoreductase [Rhodospirillaceae bacterium]
MSGKLRVGFVGIGNMGWPMAANLCRAGFAVTVFDSDAARRARFAKEFGAAAVDSLGALGANTDVCVTMLPTGAIVRQALLEDDRGALAAALPKGAIVLDMSSSEPIGTQALGKTLAARGIILIDAPVSGGVPRAEAGTLTLMIGGDDEAAIAKATPVLEAMGKQLFRTGPLGSGHAMKALNNYVAAAAFVASTEAIRVGRRFGLDPAVMVDIMNVSTGRNFNSEMTIKQHVLSGSYATGFQLGLMTKDVKIAADLAESLAIEAPLSRLTRSLWLDAREGIGERSDFTAAVKHWQRLDTH